MANPPETPGTPSPPTSSPQPDTTEWSSASAVPRSTPPAGTPASGPEAQEEPVRTIGDYELLGEIGRGGMGVVYRARERHSGRLVALKMMLDESLSDPTELRRFQLEAKATGELSHPGIIAIHHWGEHQGHPFYTMDFVPGVPLHRRLEQGPLPCEQAVRYLIGVARAVGAAHALGIVHRDLKPGNIIIDPTDQPRVLDFGLAKRRTRRPAEEPPPDEVLDVLPAVAPVPAREPALNPGAGPLTEKGAILGTAQYMAPEQARAQHERVGPAADVHALGAIFFEMLSGRPPYQGESTYDTLLQLLSEPPPPLRKLNPRVPDTLKDFCDRCLAKDPEDRYPDANALADDLEQRWSRRRRSVRFARLTLAATLALVVLQLVQLGLFRWLLFHDPASVGRPSQAVRTAWEGRPTGLERLMDLAAAQAQVGTAIREAGIVLVRLFELVVFVAAPLIAGVGTLAWLAAWIWHAERPFWIWAAWAAVGIGVLAVWVGAETPLWHPWEFFLPWALAASALAASATLLYRGWHGQDREERRGRTRRAEPYLQRLFASRVETRPSAAARQATASAIHAEDFEPGKMLHAWDGGQVQWARQKSLDRPVLVWQEATPVPSDGRAPGVVVRHPQVLALYAVRSTNEGSILVTEPAAATSLAELLEYQQLVPMDAAALAASLARALQAFHDQGACHGRLRPEWVLVRGELEPLLCPCGIPSQAEADREAGVAEVAGLRGRALESGDFGYRADVQALGRMLQSWLPQRPRRWEHRSQAPLYRVCDAAAAGAYSRAADLAADLERAIQAVQSRWWERMATTVLLTLFAIPLLVLAAWWVGGRLTEGEAVSLLPSSTAAVGLLLLLCPGALLLGYGHGRGLVQRWRLRASHASPVRLFGGRRLLTLAPVVLLALTVAVMALPGFGGNAEEASYLAIFGLLAGELAGYWLLGGCLAALTRMNELLRQSFADLEISNQAGEEKSPPR